MYQTQKQTITVDDLILLSETTRQAYEADPPPHDDCPFNSRHGRNIQKQHLRLIVAAPCICLEDIAREHVRLSGIADRLQREADRYQDAIRIHREAEHLKELYYKLSGDDDIIRRASES